uniref:Uncharacterized protein n=1 Tax=Panagrolaimus superbus TaxID=310955 RepID=A0A914YDZ0_9BILA
MKVLYSKIKAAEDDIEKWFELLLEADIDEFVIQNVENRIAINLHDVKLWQTYIDYLKELIQREYDDMESTDNENILFDDKSQVQSDENMDDGNKSRVSESEIHTMQHFCAKFFDTAKHQNFALPRPIMYYILKNSDHIVLQKLFKSCKYFFAEKFTPICYSLVETHKETSYDNEKLSLNYKDIKKRLSQNTFVTTSKEIIPRLSRSEAKYIELWNQNLSFDDLKFLIEHGNVIELFLKNCDIQEEADGNLVELEKIMEFLPNIEKFDLYPVKCNSNTGHALSNLKFNSKINYLCLANINGESFDPNEFRKFCTANQAQSFSLIMAFDIDKSLLFEFVSVMFEYAESFEDTDFKCYFN